MCPTYENSGRIFGIWCDFCIPWFSSPANLAPVTHRTLFQPYLWPVSMSGDKTQIGYCYSVGPRKWVCFPCISPVLFPWGTGHKWSSWSFHFPKSFCLLESTLLHVFLPMLRSHLKATDTAALPLLRADLSAFSTALLCTVCQYPVYVHGVAALNGLCVFRLSPVWLSLGVKGAKYRLEWWSEAEKQRPWWYCQRAMGTLYLHCEILIVLTSDFEVLFWGQPCASWRSRAFVGCVESGESWRELEQHYPEISSHAFGQKLWMVVSRDSCVLEGGSNKMMKE